MQHRFKGWSMRPTSDLNRSRCGSVHVLFMFCGISVHIPPLQSVTVSRALRSLKDG